MILALTLLFASAPPADAAACRQIADAAARLACYDAATSETAPEVPSAPTAPVAPVADVAPAPVAAPVAVAAPTDAEKSRIARFGLRPERAAPAPAEAITAAVDRIELGRANATRIYLTNGQIWQQVDHSSDPLPWGVTRKPQTATIKDAALGSFRMRLEPIGETIRVKRIK